jgi:hypothetical protein
MINTKDLKKWDDVRVEWEDIVGAGPAWEQEDEEDGNILTVARCHTVGFVIRGWSKHAKSLMICGSVTDGTVSDKTVFPKGCILNIWIRSRLTEEWTWDTYDHVILGNP